MAAPALGFICAVPTDESQYKIIFPFYFAFSLPE
jgi:hypothetical protein